MNFVSYLNILYNDLLTMQTRDHIQSHVGIEPRAFKPSTN